MRYWYSCLKQIHKRNNNQNHDDYDQFRIYFEHIYDDNASPKEMFLNDEKSEGTAKGLRP